jgi:TolB-like protein/DNA-binding winged helix-turn-helix (wHTH) protein/Tfp pilus assembly protein PilF
MAPQKAVPTDLVLDLASFQLVRSGQRVKLEKTPMELLALLVQRRGALVGREEIVRSIWGDAVHIDADAGINTAIRKIRQALDDDSTSPLYLETVVGKGYRFIGPITVVTHGSAAPTAAANPPWWSHRGVRVALLAMAAAALLLITLWAPRRPAPSVSANRQERLLIAVVPLQNLSQQPGQDYFVEGLTDEILTQLGQLNPARLGVIRYASPKALGQSVPAIPRASSQPGLQYLLEGSVRRVHDRARISVQLVRMSDNATLWGSSFDRHIGDVLSLQSEIAQRIGHELQIQVLGRSDHEPSSPEVEEAYLRGRFELDRPDIRDAARAYFERAIASDPSYAPAYAGLADFYRARAIGDDEGAEQAWRLAEQNADRALALDSESAETHTAIAQIKLMHDWDWPAAREHALRALQLNPSSPEAHAVYARYLRIAGDVRGAVNQREKALALDPFRVDLRVQLILEYFFARDYRNAMASAREILEGDPNNRFGHGALCSNLGRLKLFDQAAAECSKTLALEGHADWAPSYLREYHKRGFEAADLLVAKKVLSEELKHSQPDLWELANAYVLAGQKEEALRTLMRGLRIHEPGLLQIRVDPDFDSIRDDPRYTELVRQIGFPTE